MDIVYQSADIRVSDHLDDDGETQRQLYIGPSFTHCQGAVKLQKPWYHVHQFTRHLTYAAMTVPTTPTRVLFLGLGAGVAVNSIGALYPSADLDVVDNCQELFHVSHRYFYSLDRDTIHLIHADAADYLLAAHQQYDLICCDVWTSVLDAPSFLKTSEFYDRMRLLLTNKGVFAINAPASDHKRISEVLASRFNITVSVKGNNAFFISSDQAHFGATIPPTFKDDVDYNIDIKAIESSSIELRMHK